MRSPYVLIWSNPRLGSRLSHLQRACGSRVAWAAGRMRLTGCHERRWPPERHRLAAASFFAEGLLPPSRRLRQWARACMDRPSVSASRLLTALSHRVQVLCARQLPKLTALQNRVAAHRATPGIWSHVSGEQIPGVWRLCATRSWSAVAASIHAIMLPPYGVVLGGARPELSSSPQSFPELNQCIYVILMDPSKYFIGQK